MGWWEGQLCPTHLPKALTAAVKAGFPPLEKSPAKPDSSGKSCPIQCHEHNHVLLEQPLYLGEVSVQVICLRDEDKRCS